MGRVQFVAALTLTVGMSLSALAQTAAPASAPTDADALQEITVFAQKRKESAQDVPIAITAVSSTDIANWRLNNTNDLQDVTPNLTIGSVYQGVAPQLTLRGVGVNDGLSTSAPSVGTYIDQLYMGASTAAVMTMFDLDRVEVLRGPQGTLYGKNTNGGAINLYTQRPTDDFRGEVDVEAGNYSERSGSAFLSGPILGPELTGRISVFYRDRSGYGEVLAPGPVQYSDDQVWAEHDYGVRGEILFKPTDDMQWLFIAATGQNKITYGWPVLGLRNPGNPSVDCANPFSGTCVDALGEHVYGTVSPYSTIQSQLSYTIPATSLETLQGTWTLGSVELTSITAYIHAHQILFDHGGSDYVGTGIFNFGQNNTDNQWSEEFRVASVGAQRFNWTTGLYLLSDTDTIPAFYNFGGYPGTTNFTKVTESYAAFAQSDYAITPALKLTAGLRYSYSGITLESVDLGGFTTNASDHWGSFGGRAGLEYRLTDTTLAYATYNRGFKEGNITEQIYDSGGPGPASFIKPEFINAFEIGAKSDITRQIRLNGDVFLNKLTDMQVAGIDPAAFNEPTLTNAAKATTYGVELELTARPVPDLLLSANYGYLRAYFENYYVISVYSPAPSFPTTVVDASGKPIPLSPANTISGQAQYTFHVGNGGTITPRVNYSYRSRQTFTPEGYNPEGSQSGYGLLGAGLKYDSADKLEIDFWGRNLTNKAYLVDAQPGDSFNGTDFLTYGQPRMYGVTLRKKF